MTTHVFSAAPSNASDASFRAWGSAISNALAAVGMVKVTTPGQVDWTTVTAPAAASTAAGWEIWRFNDDLQAVAPIFFKVEYGVRGSGTTPATLTPCLWLTVGKDSDATGTVLLTLLDRELIGLDSNTLQSSPGASVGYASSCPSGACVVLAPWAESSVVTSPMFVIERSRDNTGAPTTDGVMVAVQHPTSAYGSGSALNSHGTRVRVQAATYDSRAWNRSAPPVSLPMYVNGAAVTGSSGLAVGVVAPSFPWVLYAPGVAPWQSLAVQTYMQGDAVAGVSSVRVLGQNHTYRTLPVGTAVSGWGLIDDPDVTTSASLSPRAGVMILWED